jgi:hypothetical protein
VNGRASLLLTAAAIVALGLTAVRPLFGPDLPCSDDILFHLFRLAQLDHLWRQGVFYSRWAPDMAQGYGYPFFNFYAPLAYYAAALLSRLVMSLTLGLKLTFALAILGSGLAMYRLVRDHFSAEAALVAAVAYMYAPYQSYDALFRGNLAEAAAWPLLPLALWTMGRLARQGGGRWLAAAAVTFAAVILTHNVFALIFTPLLVAHAAVELGPWLKEPGAARPWSHLRQTAVALSLGLALSAFFWLPALLERSLVYSERLLTPPHFAYWNHFLAWPEIWSWPQVVYPDLQNPSPARALGLLFGLWALPAVVYLFRAGRPQPRRQVFFFGLALAVYLFLMTAVSQPLWEKLPFLVYVQFPWRLLGPAALCLAVLIAATIDLLPRPAWTRLAAVLAIITLVLSSLAWLDARYCAGPAAPTISEMQAFERQTELVGTTAAAEYLPRTVATVPWQPADRLFTVAPFAPGASLTGETNKGVTAAVSLRSDRETAVVANVFAYPGWRVWVDGQPVAVTPAAATGLVTFTVPAGERQIEMRFGETPLRLAANVLSWLALVVLFMLAVGPDGRIMVTTASPPALSWPASAIGLGLLLVAATYWLPRLATPLYRPTLSMPGLAPAAIAYPDGLRLAGLKQLKSEMAADQTLPLDLYWTVQHTPGRDYQTTIYLVGADGRAWSAVSSGRPRHFRPPLPTTAWQPGQFAVDAHLLTPLPGTPPGVYDLQLTLFDRHTLQPLRPEPGSAVAPAGSVLIGQVTLTRPQRSPDVAELSLQYVAEGATGATGEDVRLVGYNLDRLEAAPGDPFLLTLFWQARTAPAVDLTAVLELHDADGRKAFSLALDPVRPDFPTRAWQAGDLWRGQHSLRLPASLASGVYQWRLRLCAASGTPQRCWPSGETIHLNSLRIEAPVRLWQPPALAIDLQSASGKIVPGAVATLLGANLIPPLPNAGKTLGGREMLTISLAWRAEQETSASYHVFVHWLAEDGRLLAQSDSIPAAWQRPTTGWLPGEIIVDQHTLPVPADLPTHYSLVAGLYDPDTGVRIGLGNGDTAVVILKE